MKIFCVSGGNYKSFYLNAFLKIKGYDLLVINFGIMYNIVEDLKENDVVVKELKMLHSLAKVPIIAGVYIGDKKTKKLIKVDNNKFEVRSINTGMKIRVKSKDFVIDGKFTNFKDSNKIVLTEERLYPKAFQCSYNKIYVFCDSFGITKIEKRKISRKFYKYAKIILK